MKVIVAVDPGPVSSGIVVVHARTYEIKDAFLIDSQPAQIETVVREYHDKSSPGVFLMEKLVPAGKKVGHEVFDTIYFTGRLHQMILENFPTWELATLGRKKVLAHLDPLYTTNSNDSRVRTLLKERFGDEFTAKLKADTWQAYAVAVTWMDGRPKKQGVRH